MTGRAYLELSLEDRERMELASACNRAADYVLAHHGGDIAGATRRASLLREIVDFLWPTPKPRAEAERRVVWREVKGNGAPPAADAAKADSGAAALGVMVTHLTGSKGAPAPRTRAAAALVTPSPGVRFSGTRRAR